MLADGFVAQARAGLAEEDGRHDHEHERQIHHRALVKQQRPDHRDILQPRDGDGGHRGDLLEVGAGAEIDPVDERRQRRRKDVHRHAVDRMVRAERDRGERVDHIDQNTGQRAAQQPQPVRPRHIADQKAHQRADGRQTLQTDVDHTGPLAVELREGDQQHGNGQTDRCQQ